MTSALSDPTFGTSSTIGKYFGVVSAMPSLLLTVYVFLLLASGAWTHRPSLTAIGHAVDHFTVAQGVALVALALVLALAMHGLQLGMVQFLEGYWGGNAFARIVRGRRVNAHRERLMAAYDQLDAVRADLAALQMQPVAPAQERARSAALSAIADIEAFIRRYPRVSDNVMATRLGNVLRRYEDRAGAAYGLNSIQVAAHLGLVAPERHIAYLQDQRSHLDLSARLCATSLIATAVTVALTWPWGWWLLAAAAPYLLGYLAYRGAVAAAGDYGIALMTVVDLNRFALYDALRLEPPTDTDAERTQNRRLSNLLAGAKDTVTYKHP